MTKLYIILFKYIHVLYEFLENPFIFMITLQYKINN